jgi:predicted small metal-binding protein
MGIGQMTRRLECIVDGCDATIEGISDDEIMAQAEKHAAKEHPDLELDDELVEELKSHIVAA